MSTRIIVCESEIDYINTARTMIIICFCASHPSFYFYQYPKFILRNPAFYIDLEEWWIKLLTLHLWKTNDFLETISMMLPLTLLEQSESTFKYILDTDLEKRMKIIFPSNNALTTPFLLFDYSFLPCWGASISSNFQT